MYRDSNASEYILSECLEYVLTQDISELESQYIPISQHTGALGYVFRL